MASDRHPQSATDAVAVPNPAATLADLEAIADRSRRSGLVRATGWPMVVWGIAWLVGYVALGLLPGPPGLAIALTASVAATTVTWRGRAGTTRTGWEPQLRAAWVVLMLASPLLVVVAQPGSVAEIALLLGGLWALGLALYGVASRDRSLVALGLALLSAATVFSLWQHDAALAGFGVVSGTTMVAFGTARTARVRRRSPS